MVAIDMNGAGVLVAISFVLAFMEEVAQMVTTLRIHQFLGAVLEFQVQNVFFERGERAFEGIRYPNLAKQGFQRTRVFRKSNKRHLTPLYPPFCAIESHSDPFRAPLFGCGQSVLFLTAFFTEAGHVCFQTSIQ